MLADQPSAHEPHPFHTLISWPAVIAGALVAIAIGAMLNLLGVALGAASLNPFDLSREEAAGFSAGAGAWVAIANTIALAIGGFVASRTAKFSDHHRGFMHGLAVWALAFMIALLIAGSTAAGGLTAVLNGVSQNETVADVTYEAPLAGDRLAGDRLSDEAPAVPPPAQREVEETADATTTIALWAFLTMLLGAIGAIAGARYGIRRHGWETKAKINEGHPAAPTATTTTTVPGGPAPIPTV